MRKITCGSVIQTFGEDGKLLKQEFVAEDEFTVEGATDPSNNDFYAPFDMVQPNDEDLPDTKEWRENHGCGRDTSYVDCIFSSIWDGGTVIDTPAKYNPQTGHIKVLYQNEGHDVDCLTDEVITVGDQKILVCMNCHEYTVQEITVDTSQTPGECNLEKREICRGNCPEY